MKIFLDDYGELQRIHLCFDGSRWMILERNQGELYHGFLFAPDGAILAHFYNKSDVLLESQLRGALSSYRAGTHFVNQNLLVQIGNS